MTDCTLTHDAGLINRRNSLAATAPPRMDDDICVVSYETFSALHFKGRGPVFCSSLFHSGVHLYDIIIPEFAILMTFSSTVGKL